MDLWSKSILGLFAPRDSFCVSGVFCLATVCLSNNTVKKIAQSIYYTTIHTNQSPFKFIKKNFEPVKIFNI